jgi:Ran GTPase-activating protein (RanGAP) involved in mRNA processing and transport
MKVNRTLAEVNLRGNAIGTMGSAPLADALKANSHCKRLDLASNGIGEEGCWLIADALKTNSTLLWYRVSGCAAAAIC